MTNLMEAFAELGKLVGKGKITVAIKCEDGTKNNITWEGSYSKDAREDMMVRALRILYEAIIQKRADAIEAEAAQSPKITN